MFVRFVLPRGPAPRAVVDRVRRLETCHLSTACWTRMPVSIVELIINKQKILYPSRGDPYVVRKSTQRSLRCALVSVTGWCFCTSSWLFPRLCWVWWLPIHVHVSWAQNYQAQNHSARARFSNAWYCDVSSMLLTHQRGSDRCALANMKWNWCFSCAQSDSVHGPGCNQGAAVLFGT